MTLFEFPGAPPARVMQVSTPSLGDHSYVIVAGDRAVVVDPQRDVGRFEAAIAASGATLAAVAETHIHNDYVSGGAVLASRWAADYILPAGSGASVEHLALGDGEEHRVADWRIRAIHTPGHTPHHMSYALVDPGGVAVAIFSGGSMLVGAVGRSDLLGPEHTDALVRQQYFSVRRLAAGFADSTRVGPTHGAGSFCSVSEAADATTTIGTERRRNPALLAATVEEFALAQLAGSRLFPAYYAHMGAVNLAGAGPMPDRPLPELGVDDVAVALAAGMPVVDLRPAADWAGGHLPGTIDVPISDEVATYVGWVLPWNAPVVLLAAERSHVDEARLQLARIGHDAVVGFAVGIEDRWQRSGRALSSVRVAGFADMMREEPAVRLDVRDPREVEEAGAVAGALNVHVGRVLAEMDRIPAGTVWVSCASGFRSAVAAGLLEQGGRTPVLVLGAYDEYRSTVGAAG